jgi:hypothetical protein
LFRNLKDNEQSNIVRRTRSKSMENFSTDMENMLHNDDKRRHDRNSLLKNCATHQSLDSILEVDINFGNQYQVIIKTKKKIYVFVKND